MAEHNERVTRDEWVPADDRYVRPRGPRPALERRNAYALDRRAGEGEVPLERRADERRHAAAPGRPGSTAGFLQRFRQPIIGVGLASAALPLVASVEAPGSPSEAPETDEAAAGRAASDDVEEELATVVAAERAAIERAEIVQAAIGEYGIARDLAEDIFDAAVREGIEPDVAYGLVRTESTFDERAKSHVGALGLTQVMPRTAAWIAPGTTAQDLYDRQTNLRLGFRYLDQMIEKYRGDVKLALLAYNRGPGTVDRVLDRGGNPDNGYAAKVLRD
jgi:soluble lytic murein transglycosylase-like protein